MRHDGKDYYAFEGRSTVLAVKAGNPQIPRAGRRTICLVWTLDIGDRRLDAWA
jgi:hypothetical protein